MLRRARDLSRQVQLRASQIRCERSELPKDNHLSGASRRSVMRIQVAVTTQRPSRRLRNQVGSDWKSMRDWRHSLCTDTLAESPTTSNSVTVMSIPLLVESFGAQLHFTSADSRLARGSPRMALNASRVSGVAALW